MNRVQLSGAHRRRQVFGHLVVPATDFSRIRSEFDSRLFVGPPCPAHLLAAMAPSAESIRYARMVDQFVRYGHVEFAASGTPWLGDVFGIN